MSQGWRMRAYMDRTGSVRETMDDSRKAWRISKNQLRGSPTAPAALPMKSIR